MLGHNQGENMTERFFEINHKDSSCNARTGVMHLPHGDVLTPVFMPVGTKGTVKAISKDDLEESLPQMTLL